MRFLVRRAFLCARVGLRFICFFKRHGILCKYRAHTKEEEKALITQRNSCEYNNGQYT